MGNDPTDQKRLKDLKAYLAKHGEPLDMRAADASKKRLEEAAKKLAEAPHDGKRS